MVIKEGKSLIMVLLLKIKKFLVMHVDDLFDERIQPEQNKQLVPKPMKNLSRIR